MTAIPREIPTVDFGGRQTAPRPGTLTTAARLFLDQGCLLIRGAFTPGYVRQLYRAFVDGYRSYFQDREFPDALKVGDKRTMITVEIQGRFNSPRLYANRAILPLLERLLGRDLILGGLGSVVSLPGAKDQHVHRDYPHIFDEPGTEGARKGSVLLLPPYAVTLFVPLVPINDVTGTTRLWPGSQTLPVACSQDRTGVDPVAALGDCLLMDYRLLHHGTANRSQNIRPVLYLIYHRRWFRDSLNYEKQDAIQISDVEYRKIPARSRSLLDWLPQDPGYLQTHAQHARPVQPPHTKRRKSRRPGR